MKVFKKQMLSDKIWRNFWKKKNNPAMIAFICIRRDSQMGFVFWDVNIEMRQQKTGLLGINYKGQIMKAAGSFALHLLFPLSAFLFLRDRSDPYL